ncbi:MAG: magnesium chelatase ATPase subunit I [Pseudomonadota bacterium]
MAIPYPFSALAGQDEMRRALMIAAVDPGIGGVMVFGDRGTGKSTAVRGLGDMLPAIEVVAGCPYNTKPAPNGRTNAPDPCPIPVAERTTARVPVPVVDLPLGATEDRVVGALDLERALAHGEKAFEPGLLARAHRGFLYIDEINLLDDHIVDLLLDVAASGENIVEREGVSVRHPAKFVLIGSGNPEEGELRPQLLDRFGLSVDVTTPDDIETRLTIIRRRLAFEADPSGFTQSWQTQTDTLRAEVQTARAHLADVTCPAAVIEDATRLCMALGTDGLRGELTLIRAATALAALDGATTVTTRHLHAIAPSALRHRLRRNPLDESGSTTRVMRALDEILPGNDATGNDATGHNATGDVPEMPRAQAVAT